MWRDVIVHCSVETLSSPEDIDLNWPRSSVEYIPHYNTVNKLLNSI